MIKYSRLGLKKLCNEGFFEISAFLVGRGFCKGILGPLQLENIGRTVF